MPADGSEAHVEYRGDEPVLHPRDVIGNIHTHNEPVEVHEPVVRDEASMPVLIWCVACDDCSLL